MLIYSYLFACYLFNFVLIYVTLFLPICLMGRDNYWYIININKIKLSKKINLIEKELIFNLKKFKNIF